MTERDPRSAGAFAPTRRRDLLVGIGLAAVLTGGALTVASRAAPALATPPPTAFIGLSRFITGAPLTDAPAMARAWAQLSALDAAFPTAVQQLYDRVRGGGFKTMADFLASPLGKDAAALKTVSTITSAFYLGYTGTPGSNTATDDTGFVTFAGALMWRPTAGLMVIPTYAIGGADYWIDPPAGTPTPPGPARVREWGGSTPAKTSPKAA